MKISSSSSWWSLSMMVMVFPLNIKETEASACSRFATPGIEKKFFSLIQSKDMYNKFEYLGL